MLEIEDAVTELKNAFARLPSEFAMETVSMFKDKSVEIFKLKCKEKSHHHHHKTEHLRTVERCIMHIIGIPK